MERAASQPVSSTILPTLAAAAASADISPDRLLGRMPRSERKRWDADDGVRAGPPAVGFCFRRWRGQGRVTGAEVGPGAEGSHAAAGNRRKRWESVGSGGVSAELSASSYEISFR